MSPIKKIEIYFLKFLLRWKFLIRKKNQLEKRSDLF